MLGASAPGIAFPVIRQPVARALRVELPNQRIALELFIPEVEEEASPCTLTLAIHGTSSRRFSGAMRATTEPTSSDLTNMAHQPTQNRR